MKQLTEKIRTRYNPAKFAFPCQWHCPGSQDTPPLGMEGMGEWYQPEREIGALRCLYRL